MTRLRIRWFALPVLGLGVLGGCLMSRLEIASDASAGAGGNAGENESESGSSSAGERNEGGRSGKGGLGAGGKATPGDAGSDDGGDASGGTPTGGAKGSGGAPSGGAPSGGAPSGGAPAGGAGPTQLPPFDAVPQDKPDTVEVGVRNNCAAPIWVHGNGAGGQLLAPDNSKVESGATVWLDAAKQFNGSIAFFATAAQTNALQAIYVTMLPTNDHIIYELTYVDWLGLPLELLTLGSGSDCKRSGCYITQATIATGCPSGLLDMGRCSSPGTYCKKAGNSGMPICSALAPSITHCAMAQTGCQMANGESSVNAYNCAGFFGTNPKFCAAINRGMVDNPLGTTISEYYKTAPYNTYAKWVHGVCPGIYAFPYDDFPMGAEEGADHNCENAKALEITLCPSG